jgi:hypothetical protein
MYLRRPEYLSTMTSRLLLPSAFTVTVVVTVTGTTSVPVHSLRMI